MPRSYVFPLPKKGKVSALRAALTMKRQEGKLVLLDDFPMEGFKTRQVLFASETCALDLIGAKFEREVEPGELIVVDRDGLRSYRPFPTACRAHCVFELIYFARPDSLVFGRTVHDVRKRLGRRLAEETNILADVVVVPDSGVPAAMRFAEAAGIPFDFGLIRNHYVGRTFIEPRQSIRHFGVKLKLNPVRSVVERKRVVVVDDSIVRGTTSRKIVKMLRASLTDDFTWYRVTDAGPELMVKGRTATEERLKAFFASPAWTDTNSEVHRLGMVGNTLVQVEIDTLNMGKGPLRQTSLHIYEFKDGKRWREFAFYPK